jgi:hypothetical protein
MFALPFLSLHCLICSVSWLHWIPRCPY